jgi:hypothetical protein
MTGAAPGTAGGVLAVVVVPVVLVVEEAAGGEVVEVDGRTEGVAPPCPDVFPACAWPWGTVGAATVTGLGAGAPLPEREAARATAAPTTKTATAITAPASHRSLRRSPHRDPPSLDGWLVSTTTGASARPGGRFGWAGRGWVGRCSVARGSVGVGRSGGRRTTTDGGIGGSPADSRTRRTALSIAPRARRPGVPWGGSDAGPSVMASLRDMFPHCRASMRAPRSAPPGSCSGGGSGRRSPRSRRHEQGRMNKDGWSARPVGLRRRTGGCHAIGSGALPTPAPGRWSAASRDVPRSRRGRVPGRPGPRRPSRRRR